MNIIIPIGGVGKRFEAEGFRLPKPLIRALGKPMIFWTLEHLNTQPDDVIWIVYRAELDQFSFQGLILKRFPDRQIEFISIERDTKGAAETVLFALEKMTSPQLQQTTLIVDVDNFYPTDILSIAREKKENLIFFTNDVTPKPIYSYITIENEKVLSIKEKVKISDNACVGAYCFKDGDCLKNYILQRIKEPLPENKEYFISTVYEEMLRCNEWVHSCEIDGFMCLGTPNQLRIFASNWHMSPDVFHFAIDPVSLAQIAAHPKDFHVCGPKEKYLIQFLHFLNRCGQKISIGTNSEIGKTDSEGKLLWDTEILQRWIKSRNIPFIEHQKESRTVDFRIHPHIYTYATDYEKEFGFYNIHSDARMHHTIEFRIDKVIKKAEVDGERYFYEHIPAPLQQLFPKVQSSSIDCLVLERIQGIPISYMYQHGMFTEDLLYAVFKNLELLHSYPCRPDGFIYENYSAKFTDRLKKINVSGYPGLKEGASGILHFLQSYELDRKGIAGIIHGDPVMTNILINHAGELFFIDVRGKQGETLSIYGDIFYDYAKLYQSISGYDYILSGYEIDNNVVQEFQNYFRKYIIDKFGASRMEDIRWITKSLLLSLIPLHEEKKHVAFFNLMTSL